MDALGLSGEAEFDTGFGVLGAAGYGFDAFGSATVRLEAEVAYRQSDVDEVLGLSAGDAEVSALSGMVNLAVDILTWSIVEPYVLVGIGAANVTLESDDLDADDDDTVFAYRGRPAF